MFRNLFRRRPVPKPVPKLPVPPVPPVQAQIAPITATKITTPALLMTKPTMTPEEERALNSSVCRSTPNGLNNLFQNINNCTSQQELTRNEEFGQNIINLQQDITDLKANITDSISKGDLLFGTQPHNQIIQQVIERNKELKMKKEKLSKDILSKEALIERTDQDFRDVKQTVPDPQPKKILRFVEDYSIAFLLLSYLFMLISGIYWYMKDAEFIGIALLQALVGSGVLSVFLFMFLLHIA